LTTTGTDKNERAARLIEQCATTLSVSGLTDNTGFVMAAMERLVDLQERVVQLEHEKELLEAQLAGKAND
jgi:hypothetical protein